jgi:hypothetical protein
MVERTAGDHSDPEAEPVGESWMRKAATAHQVNRLRGHF